MFSEKKGTSNTTLDINRISKNTSIVGDIISEGDFRIDGTVEGSIKTSRRVIIGADGIVKGNIQCLHADIEGTFAGDLTVGNMLTLKATAKITGEVVAGKLSVEPGASFNATCSMKSTVKELNEKKAAKKTA